MNAAALSRFELAAQSAREQLHPCTVRIGEVDYAAAAVVGEIRWELTEQGWKLQQTLDCTIRKTALAAPPEMGATLLHVSLGKAFKLRRIEGDQATDAAWQLNATRQPGKDEAP